jgi:hypothetical protein
MQRLLNPCSAYSLLSQTLLLLCLETHRVYFLELLLDLSLLVRHLKISVCFTERVNQDGQEQVQEDEVPDEDPRNVVNGSDCFKQHVVLCHSHRGVEDTLPVLHSQHLENSNEGHCECFKVLAWQLFTWAEVILSLENLPAEQSVDENEDEHQECDQDEVHKGSLDDPDNHSHGLK